MISAEVARLVRELQPLITKEQPEVLRRALCDILGVMIGHVMGKLEGAERDKMVEESLKMISSDIVDSYWEFTEWEKSK
jgi:hypothetical protein